MVRTHTVYNAIATQNNLSNQRIIDLGNDPSGLGKLSQTIDCTKNV